MNLNKEKTDILIKKGVYFPDPEHIYLGDDLDTDRISGENVTIYPGARITGGKTLISKGSRIGSEGAATVQNCYIGEDVNLKSGFFDGAVFLKGASLGNASHVRSGTILEEQASTAHSVGLKQTLLFPFVTLGSLINFCDCFMAGGTSRNDHSEVGSSYIHFNYTPNQDKATPSLIGDVTRGVMLSKKPIFLGGQGGLIGPSIINYGAVLAAGTMNRGDITEENRLIFGGALRSGNVPANTGIYRAIKRTVLNNIHYISNLMALSVWYRDIRSLFAVSHLEKELHKGLLLTLDNAINERIKRLYVLAEKMEDSIRDYKQKLKTDTKDSLVERKQELLDKKDLIRDSFLKLKHHKGDVILKENMILAINRTINQGAGDYISSIKTLKEDDKINGTTWLSGITDHIKEEILIHIPTFK